MFVFLQAVAWGQLTYRYDTLTIDHRILGPIDSIDSKSGDLPTTFELGNSILSATGQSVDRLLNDYLDVAQPAFTGWAKMEFSALPYLGFSYSFGGQGSQFIRTKYIQSFNNRVLLNIDYKRNQGGGVIRNAAFRSNDVKVQLESKGKRFSFQLRGAYLNDSVQHPGGTILDTTNFIENFGVDLLPVNRSNASSNYQRGRAEAVTYLNLTNDSINQFGLSTSHLLSVSNRRYSEFDTLFGLYNQINIDSNQTNDKYNVSSISNGAGLFWMRNAWFIDGHLLHRYWRVNNLGSDFDTTEINLHSNLVWNGRKLKLKNSLALNIVGAFNEWCNSTSIATNWKDFQVTGQLQLRNDAPTPLQRRYYGNTYAYSLAEIGLQNVLHLSGEIGYQTGDKKYAVSGLLDYAGINGAYLFNDSSWVKSSGTINMVQVGLKGRATFGPLSVLPKMITSIQEEGYLPRFQGYLRLLLKGNVFEAKKLELYGGVDASIISEFKHRIYNPAMNNYDWFALPGVTPQLINVHAFVGLSVATFRFYARFENIGYFWNNKEIREVQNYPIAGTRVRVGITWDFFN